MAAYNEDSPCGVAAEGLAVPYRPGRLQAAKDVCMEFRTLIRRYPSTIIWPLITLGVLLSFGVWGLTRMFHLEEESAKDRASSVAQDTAWWLQANVLGTSLPVQLLAALVRDQLPYHTEAYDMFRSVAPALFAQTPFKSSQVLQFVPGGVIADVVPLAGNERVIGLDIFASNLPGNRDGAIKTVLERTLTMVGPMIPVQGGRSVIFRIPIYVDGNWTDGSGPGSSSSTHSLSTVFSSSSSSPVSATEAQAAMKAAGAAAQAGAGGGAGVEAQAEAATGGGTGEEASVTLQTVNPGCGEPCDYNPATNSTFWGFISSVVAMDALLATHGSGGSRLQSLEGMGYLYRLEAPKAATENLRIIAASARSPIDPVEVPIPLPNNEWVLYVSPDSGWRPATFIGLLVAVVVVSVAIASLVFIALLTRRKNQLLLETLVPRQLIPELRAAAPSSAKSMTARQRDLDTPADLLIELLGDLMDGRMPPLTDLVLLRSALLGQRDLYEPLNMRNQINKAVMDDDVADALMRQLLAPELLRGYNSRPGGADGANADGNADGAERRSSSVHKEDMDSFSGAMAFLLSPAAAASPAPTAAPRRSAAAGSPVRRLLPGPSLPPLWQSAPSPEPDPTRTLSRTDCSSLIVNSSNMHPSRATYTTNTNTNTQPQHHFLSTNPNISTPMNVITNTTLEQVITEGDDGVNLAEPTKAPFEPKAAAQLSPPSNQAFGSSLLEDTQPAGGAARPSSSLINSVLKTLTVNRRGGAARAPSGSWDLASGNAPIIATTAAAACDPSAVLLSDTRIQPLLLPVTASPQRPRTTGGGIGSVDAAGGGFESMVEVVSADGGGGGGSGGGGTAAAQPSGASGDPSGLSSDVEEMDVQMLALPPRLSGRAPPAAARKTLQPLPRRLPWMPSTLQRSPPLPPQPPPLPPQPPPQVPAAVAPPLTSDAPFPVERAHRRMVRRHVSFSNFRPQDAKPYDVRDEGQVPASALAAAAKRLAAAAAATAVAMTAAVAHTQGDGESDRSLRKSKAAEVQKLAASPAAAALRCSDGSTTAELQMRFPSGMTGMHVRRASSDVSFRSVDAAAATVAGGGGKAASAAPGGLLSLALMKPAGQRFSRLRAAAANIMHMSRSGSVDVLPCMEPSEPNEGHSVADNTTAGGLTTVVTHPLPPVDFEGVERLLSQAYTGWQFNMWTLQQETQGHALSVLGFFLMQRSGLISTLGISGVRLARLLRRLEAGYNDNPYHNATHAADVLQTLHVLLHATQLTVHYLDPLGLLAAYFAAIIHDLGHPGLTGDFLIATSDGLALRYNDRSPLENHHCAAAFELLHQHPDLDITAGMSPTEKTTFRKQVIELVLATDMKQHLSTVTHFNTVHRLHSTKAFDVPNSSSGGGLLKSAPGGRLANVQWEIKEGDVMTGDGAVTPSVPPVEAPKPQDDTERLLSLQVALKVADLGHLAKDMNVHQRWLSALEEEFFRQGDREKQSGLPVSPLFDRAKQGVSKSQVGFFEFVALPLANAMVTVFPGAQPFMDCLTKNYRHWRRQARAAEAAARAAGAATCASNASGLRTASPVSPSGGDSAVTTTAQGSPAAAAAAAAFNPAAAAASNPAAAASPSGAACSTGETAA